MKRVLWILLILGAILLPSHCGSETASPSPPTLPAAPVLDQHLVLGITGTVTHKRPGWDAPQPLSFGAPLDQHDLLQAASNAEAVVVCADLSRVQVEPGYLGGPPCPEQGTDLSRGRSLMLEPRRGSVKTVPIPYILAPRNTFVSSPYPLLRWNTSGAGTTTYTVRVSGSPSDWYTKTTVTQLRYPEDAPVLQPLVPYHVTVVDADGRTSSEEQTNLDLGFVLLPGDEIAKVEALVAQAQALDLDEAAVQMLEAEIYAGYTPYALRGDAIAVLQELAVRVDSPVVLQRLGDLYLKVGLYTEARGVYEQALTGYRALEDQAGEARALAGLGLAFWGDRDAATAKEKLQDARTLYQDLGDADGANWVDELAAQAGL